jgi:hypothetical protein
MFLPSGKLTRKYFSKQNLILMNFCGENVQKKIMANYIPLEVCGKGSVHKLRKIGNL